MGTILCSYCGAALKEDDKFCPYCGRQVAQAAYSDPVIPGETQVIQPPASPSHAAGPKQAIPKAAQRDKPYRIAAAPRTTDTAVMQKPAAHAQPAQNPASSYGGLGAADSPTRIIGMDDCQPACGEDDIDSPTTVIPMGPTAYLLRRRTGEKLEVATPAIVGKGSAATMRIGGNSAISRTHLSIDEADGEFSVCDLGSTNRTSINDARIRPGEKAKVKSGDAIRMADEDFDFIIEDG